MTDPVGVKMVCNKCKKFKLPWTETNKKIMKEHLRECDEEAEKPPQHFI